MELIAKEEGGVYKRTNRAELIAKEEGGAYS